jgi:hypothetical protein
MAIALTIRRILSILPAMILSHQKCAKKEGREVLLGAGIVVFGFTIMQFFTFPWHWERDPFFVGVFLAIEYLDALLVRPDKIGCRRSNSIKLI